MNLARHYRTLELHRGASSGEVKAAYRKLVRQYHPDINPDQAAIEQFIKINDAYTALLEALPADNNRTNRDCNQAQTSSFGFDGRLNNFKQAIERLGLGNFNVNQADAAVPFSEGSVSQPLTQQIAQPLSGAEESATTTYFKKEISAVRPLSAQEESLKQEAYQQLKDLLRQRKFPRATALVEGLAHRMPDDSEIVQWQAIVYQRWGRRLIDEGQPQKARIYLKKALRTDPNNPSLWREINRDFWHLANLGAPSGVVL